MSSGHKLLAWWQLLRAGNVFTAISNVIAGYLITQQSWEPVGPLLLVILASALLYEGGMVLNDVLDAELDAVERPERPIPSGSISRKRAAVVGWVLLVGGVSSGGLASYLDQIIWPVSVATFLAICIVGYDAGLKSTLLGPWTMGACRTLNVMLGAYAAAENWQTNTWWYAGAVGIYTVGLTYFARSENEAGWKISNTVGAAMIVATTTCVAYWAWRLQANATFVLFGWLAMNLWIWRVTSWITLAQTAPGMLRGAVGRIIVGFILLDALMVFAVMGWESALAVLSLLIPTWIASRWAPMT